MPCPRSLSLRQATVLQLLVETAPPKHVYVLFITARDGLPGQGGAQRMRGAKWPGWHEVG